MGRPEEENAPPQNHNAGDQAHAHHSSLAPESWAVLFAASLRDAGWMCFSPESADLLCGKLPVPLFAHGYADTPDGVAQVIADIEACGDNKDGA